MELITGFLSLFVLYAVIYVLTRLLNKVSIISRLPWYLAASIGGVLAFIISWLIPMYGRGLTSALMSLGFEIPILAYESYRLRNVPKYPSLFVVLSLPVTVGLWVLALALEGSFFFAGIFLMVEAIAFVAASLIWISFREWRMRRVDPIPPNPSSAPMSTGRRLVIIGVWFVIFFFLVNLVFYWF